jgi:hypothetical protein
MANKKNKKGFIAVRGSYLPDSWQGWLTYIPFGAYLVCSPVLAINNTDTITIAALFIAPNWVAAAVVMTWIAKRTS